MRSSSCFALAVLFSLALQLPAEEPAKGKSKPRFSADAINLFSELSQAYDLNGRRIASGKFAPGVLERLARSDEKEVKELAGLAPKLKDLHALSRAQNKQAWLAIRAQAKEAPKALSLFAIKVLLTPESERASIRTAAKMLEDLAGSDLGPSSPQAAVNKAWATACLGNWTGISMRNMMRKMANRAGPAGADLKNSVAVTLETEGRRLGAITLTNRTRSTLHHCLIFTRLDSDKDRLATAHKQEDLVGAFILPALGFSKTTVEGSRDAARLRTEFNKQEKGVMIYVPEIPPFGTVTTLLAQPGYYLISKGASMSIWCDELAIDPKPASNWDEARRATEKLFKRTIPAKGR